MGDAEIRILLLEDSPSDAKMVIRELNKRKSAMPVSIEHVGRLSLALERLKKNQFDVILTDLKLPDSDGLETVTRLLERAHKIPVVVMTGTYLDEGVALEAIRHGAQDYLFKDQMDGALLTRVIRHAVERNHLQQELVKLSQMKDEFISMVSHELRTPLTVIKEGVGLVQDGSAGALNPDQQTYLDLAKRSIDRLARLINDVLDFQKFESKQMEIRMTENNINELVNEIKESFALVAKNKGLELSVDLEERLPRIFFDRDKIVQVLTNFMSNAIKAMEKGKITLKTRCLENAVRVSVEDQGPGIKEEDIPKLFQPFSQLAMGNERKPGSTGLGLAISKQIIDRHKGKIGVESVWGKGTTFYFTIPQGLEIPKKKLGEILVEKGWISEEKIKEALKNQEGLANEK